MNNSRTTRTFFISLACLSAALPAWGGSAPCTVDVDTGVTVNGKTLWPEVPHAAPRGNSPCEVDQFAWNNFLYLVSNDSHGKPRFMSLAPWYQALPATGKPVWKGVYTPLSATQLKNKHNQVQAGDDFHLLDVAGRTVAYDMRINQDFFNYIAANQLYTKAGIASRVKAYQAAPSSGGIWLPPNGTNQGTSLEIKTAWREYGGGNACPTDIMHCEKDLKGNWWGLVGFHLVQKTPMHGELIWATFEHAGNAPDCAKGGSNPIQRLPANPRSALPPLNTNAKLGELAKATGWSFFNYDSYKTAGGDGANCAFPTATPGAKPLCLTDPNPSGDGKTWLQVNVCRSDQLPPASLGSGADASAAQQASDLNRSVVAKFPVGIADKWKYYLLAGSEYVVWGSTGFGAPTTGCWSFTDNNPPIDCGAKKGEESVTVSRLGTVNLANTTMETWMQKGISLKTAKFTVTETDCFTCHQSPTTTYQGDLSHMFGRATQAGVSAP